MWKKWDKMILVSVLFIGLVSACWYWILAAWGTSAEEVELRVNGEIHKVIRIDEIKCGEVIEIETKYGYNRIEMTKEGIRMIGADCYNHICMQQWPICDPGNSLVCAPNRLTVIVTGGSKEVDTIAH